METSYLLSDNMFIYSRIWGKVDGAESLAEQNQVGSVDRLLSKWQRV
jgi:hypothetical protein